jgi:hypothetical protein
VTGCDVTSSLQDVGSKKKRQEDAQSNQRYKYSRSPSAPIHLLSFMHHKLYVPPFSSILESTQHFPELTSFLSYSCVAISLYHPTPHNAVNSLTDYRPRHRHSPRHRSPSPYMHSRHQRNQSLVSFLPFSSFHPSFFTYPTQPRKTWVESL